MDSAKAFKRKMLLWTNNWFQEDQEPTEQFTLDAMGIARLLQATGLRSREVDLSGLADCSGCQVILKCPQSGLRVELDAPLSSCKCSTSNSAVGKKTTGQQMVEAVSILTRPSDEISKAVSQVIGGLLHVMSMCPDLNHNEMGKLNAESTLSSKPAVQHQQPMTLENTCTTITKVPVTAISTTTPITPGVVNASPRDGKSATPGRYGSLDTLIASGSNFSDDIPEPGQLTPKESRYSGPEMEAGFEVDPNATVLEGPPSGAKKFISNSSPAIYSTDQSQKTNSSIFTFGNENEEGDPAKKQNRKRMLLRSNTYISDGLGINADDEPRKGPPPRRTPSPMVPVVSQSAILSKLHDLQSTVSDIIFMVAGNESNQANIADVSRASNAILADAVKGISHDDSRPKRCLSDFGGVSNTTRVTTLVRSIPRPSIRKRMTSVPGSASPTTSKQGATASGTRRKSLSTTTLMTAESASASKTSSTTPKSGCHSRLSSQSSIRKILKSPSLKPATLGLECKKKILPAPTVRGQSSTSYKKYTHVQTSIPKSSVVEK